LWFGSRFFLIQFSTISHILCFHLTEVLLFASLLCSLVTYWSWTRYSLAGSFPSSNSVPFSKLTMPSPLSWPPSSTLQITSLISHFSYNFWTQAPLFMLISWSSWVILWNLLPSSHILYLGALQHCLNCLSCQIEISLGVYTKFYLKAPFPILSYEHSM
jgi:hypothetical protein